MDGTTHTDSPARMLGSLLLRRLVSHVSPTFSPLRAYGVSCGAQSSPIAPSLSSITLPSFNTTCTPRFFATHQAQASHTSRCVFTIDRKKENLTLILSCSLMITVSLVQLGDHQTKALIQLDRSKTRDSWQLLWVLSVQLRLNFSFMGGSELTPTVCMCSCRDWNLSIIECI